MTTKVAMALNFAIGAALTGLTLDMMEKTRKCTDTTVQRVMEGILIVSVSLLVASIAYIICHLTCGCVSTESKMAKTLFAVYFIGLGITLIVLGAIIHAKAKGNCKKATSSAMYTWILGILVVVTSVAFFIFENRESLSQTISKSK